MSPLEFLGNKESVPAVLPREIETLLKAVANDTVVRETLYDNKLMEGTDWDAWDRHAESRLIEINTAFRTQNISADRVSKWLAQQSKPGIDYPNRFWLFVDNGVPRLEINRFHQFTPMKERLLAMQDFGPKYQDQYLVLLNSKIAAMQPKPAPGELERWARSFGYGVKSGRIVRPAARQ